MIFPLLLGTGLGLMLLVVMRLGHVGHRGTVWIGAILAVAVAVAGQHYFSFVDWKRDEAAKVAQQFQGKSLFGIEEMLPAASTNFVAFMQRQAALGRHVTAGFKSRAGIRSSRRGRLGELGRRWPIGALSCLPGRLRGLPGAVLPRLPKLVSHDPREG